MNSKIPLLSIVIATKDRQKYALSAVESILSLENMNIQVVVQDNSSNNTLKDSLLKFSSDTRLVYRYTNESFSFIDNFNASIDLATGEYLCLIGDDDGVNPEVINATLWAKNNNVDAIVGNLSANYRWEGTGAPNTFFTKMTGSTLTISDFNGKAEYVDIEKSLVQLMENGCTNYNEFKLPKLYHGVVKKSCLEEIKLKTGFFISGLSPDIYASISLACVVKKLIYINYPLTIPGVCAESGSIKEGQLKNHSKKLEDAPHFKGRKNYSWNREIPKIFCVQTIWADSGFSALRDMNRDDLIAKFNRFALYANIIDADMSVKSMVHGHISELNNHNKKLFFADRIQLNLAFLNGPIFKFVKKRAIGRLKIILKLSRFKNIENLLTINEAMIALVKYLKNNNIRSAIDELEKVSK
jgi:glycosyltransferase involved in cell wall biosynthesis